jgi:hypothetical protein
MGDIAQAAVNLRGISRKARERGGKAAANGMAKVFYTNVQATLRSSSHPPGTRTPAGPGAPPSLVSGELRRSMKHTPPVAVGALSFSTRVYPTVIYARIQELGGTIHAHGRYLHWIDADGAHFVRSVTLPARPYMAPTTARLTGNGFLTRAAVRGFTDAVGG